jgi:hypothetical protein
VSGLAEKLEAQEVQIKLTRKARAWQFTLEVTEKGAPAANPDDAAAGKHSELSDKKELAAKISKQLDLMDRPSKRDDAVKELAELLEIKDVPEKPEKPDALTASKTEKAHYRTEINKYNTATKKIREQAKDKLDTLKDEIKDAEEEAKSAQAEREQQAGSKQERWKRATISARLFRTVDGSIRADDLTVGEP